MFKVLIFIAVGLVAFAAAADLTKVAPNGMYANKACDKTPTTIFHFDGGVNTLNVQSTDAGMKTYTKGGNSIIGEVSTGGNGTYWKAQYTKKSYEACVNKATNTTTNQGHADEKVKDFKEATEFKYSCVFSQQSEADGASGPYKISCQSGATYPAFGATTPVYQYLASACNSTAFPMYNTAPGACATTSTSSVTVTNTLTFTADSLYTAYENATTAAKTEMAEGICESVIDALKKEKGFGDATCEVNSISKGSTVVQTTTKGTTTKTAAEMTTAAKSTQFKTNFENACKANKKITDNGVTAAQLTVSAVDASATLDAAVSVFASSALLALVSLFAAQYLSM